jgi:hypothetical protein
MSHSGPMGDAPGLQDSEKQTKIGEIIPHAG